MSREHEIENTRVQIQVTQTVYLDPQGPALPVQFAQHGHIDVVARLKYMTPYEAADVMRATADTLMKSK